MREEPVRFDSGPVELAGTLVLPDSEGPRPAVVYTHGSGPRTRQDRFGLARVLARRGIAGLSYDKRGVGESSGYYSDSILSFEDLAADALAGVEYLKTRDEIDPDQIGLEGASQGGWVAPLAASLSTDVAFLIIMVAPTVTPYEHTMFSLKNMADQDPSNRSYKIMRAYVAAQAFFVRMLWRRPLGRGGTDRAPSSWLGNVSMSLSSAALTVMYDPVAPLERLRCPILALYGDIDIHVPTKKSIGILKQALDRANNRDYTIKSYPDSGHELSPPGLDEHVAEWLLERVRVGS